MHATLTLLPPRARAVYCALGRRLPPTAYFAGFCGMITIGIGDTMASVVGLRYGRRRWPNTKKTLEGTAAGIASSVLVSAVLYTWCPPSLALSRGQMIGYLLCLALAGTRRAHERRPRCSARAVGARAD